MEPRLERPNGPLNDFYDSKTETRTSQKMAKKGRKRPKKAEKRPEREDVGDLDGEKLLLSSNLVEKKWANETTTRGS